MDTLVLAHTYLPIGRVSWQKAITWAVTGKVQVLEEYEDRQIRSAFQVFQVPAVVRFVNTVRSLFSRKVKFNRKNVWVRDKGTCQYCNQRVSLSNFTYDHVVPRRIGGKTTWENIVVSCVECNQKKRDRTPREAGMQLGKAPSRPKYLPGMAFPTLTWDRIPDLWKDYLGSYLYWNQALDES